MNYFHPEEIEKKRMVEMADLGSSVPRNPWARANTADGRFWKYVTARETEGLLDLMEG